MRRIIEVEIEIVFGCHGFQNYIICKYTYTYIYIYDSKYKKKKLCFPQNEVVLYLIIVHDIPFSYGFPMVFLWFSYGFPMANQELFIVRVLFVVGSLPAMVLFGEDSSFTFS